MLTLSADQKKLTLEVDLSAGKWPLSSTGKSALAASTGGNMVVGDYTVGLNVMADKKRGIPV